MERAAWDFGTRLIHWGLAITITFELVSGLYVSDPKTHLYFHMHEIGGLTAAGFVVLAWLWSFADQTLGTLLCWNGRGLRRVGKELLGLFRGWLPASGPQVGLSSFVHGLGLIAASAMAATGVFIYLVIPGGRGAGFTDYGLFTGLSVVHRFLAYFLWAYLIGHLVFAILHQVRGNSVFRAIFVGATPIDSVDIGAAEADGRARAKHEVGSPHKA